MTVIVLIGVVVACILVVLVTTVVRRSPMSDDGVADFKRHLDALSPEARRPIAEALKKDRDEESDNGA
ncbi:MAG: hypothetical protein ACO3SP_06895 [Ilumatobacteraceae bacterium]